jgi:hypothetical protein
MKAKKLPRALKPLGNELNNLGLILVDFKLDNDIGGYLTFAGNIQGKPHTIYEWVSEYDPKTKSTKISYVFDYEWELTSNPDCRVRVAMLDFKYWIEELKTKQ